MTVLAIEVNLLTGRYIATEHHDRHQPEWPPHPARLFSALVATWADDDAPDPVERQALEWLEAQPPPAIHASQTTPRSPTTHFVPVNDAAIVSQYPYETRLRKIGDIEAQLEEAITEKKRQGLRRQMRTQRNVSAMVSSAGKTPVKKAVDIMPPGWMSVPRHVRTGQARAYPSSTPIEPRITYVWNTDPGHGIVRTLDSLCARLTRLGHSSSLVSCRVVKDLSPEPNHLPGEGALVLRSVRSGQLAALEAEYGKHQERRPRALPFVPVRYRKVYPTTGDDRIPQPNTAGDWLVMEFLPRSRNFPGSRNLPSIRTVDVARALRGAVLCHAAEPIPEGLSGHRRDRSASTRPHVAFLPLPWVSHEHADGRLMGAAVSMPTSLDTESRLAVLRAIGRWESKRNPLELKLGRRGVIHMRRVPLTSSLRTLQPEVWGKLVDSPEEGVHPRGQATLQPKGWRRWVSATPVALPTHPGKLSKGTATARAKAWARAEQAIVDSCRHVGLPEPTDVTVSFAPLVQGARPAPSFPSFHQPGRGGRPVARRLVHAAITFEDPVAGPLMLGSGRYLGLGLMRPVEETEPKDA